MQETWKDIAGYEGLYQVSDLGRVRSLNYHHTSEVRILKPSKDRKGYLLVKLCKNGVRKTLKVHRLVALAFVEGYDLVNNQVNHINEDKSDNRAINLEWCDVTYNNNHGTRNHRIGETQSIPVVQLTLNYKFVTKWPSSREAGLHGFQKAHVNACCRHKRSTTGGYRWLYLSEYEQICFKAYEAQHPYRLALPYRA